MTDRLFVALWPTAEACAALATATAPIRRDHADLRWQPQDRWHITLAFLGQRGIRSSARRIGRVARPAAQPVALAGAGTFGPILWAGVEHGPWLAGLAASLQRDLDVEVRRFRAHVTLARGRGSEAGAVARAAAALAGHRGPAWVPSELTLVRSTTRAATTTYEVVARWPLERADGATGPGDPHSGTPHAP